MYQFKELDDVLVRNSDLEGWKEDFILDRICGADKEFICKSGAYSQCIHKPRKSDEPARKAAFLGDIFGQCYQQNKITISK